jgi:2-amino-4-hydroxy-6-hydroxymethyldihydropteridine diphosphokinase
MTRAFIALGSNLQDPAAQVLRAFAELDQLPDTRVVARSSLYRTVPVGYDNQPDFINAVAEVSTTLEPLALLQALLALEAAHGRERPFPNAPRVLDLDLLLYDDLALHDAALTLPHPRMHERSFVLCPLAEIAPEVEIPGKGKVAALLQACPEQDIRKLAA